MSEEMTPITREEQLLDGQDLTPITRKEQFLKRIYDKSQDIPDPITREEWFLKKAGESGGGEVTVVPLTVTENGSYSEEGKAYSPVNVNVPLPQNAYLLKDAANLPDDEAVITDASALPLAEIKAEIKASQSGEPWHAASDDTAPYNYRNAPQLGHSYNQELDEIIGVSVAWNQLVQNGNFATTTGWIAQTATLNGVSNNVADVSFSDTNGQLVHNISLTNGHKFFSCVDVKIPNTTNKITFFGGSSSGETYINSTATTEWQTLNLIWNTQTYSYVVIRNSYGGVVEHVLVRNCMIFDLTQMFGSTIADYIYSLEQANTGAGVAYFRKLFPKSYYAYNAGELMSVKTSAHKTTGFNQWDEEWENRNIDDGTFNLKFIASKNFIPVVPNTQYYIKWIAANYGGNALIYFYDTNKNQIGSPLYIIQSSAFSTRDARYIKFNIWRGNVVEPYNHDICINFHWDGERDGQYEPYVEHTYALDSDLELRGIPKLDSSNKLYYDGDVYESDGTVTRKYGIVDLGSLTWTYNANMFGGSFRSTISNAGFATTGNSICAKYPTVFSGTDVTNGDKVVYTKNNGNTIYIKDSAYSDAATFKTAMNGVYLVYELATPTTESADPYTNPQIVDNWGTEEYIDTRDVPIPVGHSTKYINACPIQGFDEVVISRTSGGESKLYTIDLGTTTIYGGILDAVKGELTISWGYIASYNGETLTGEWLSDRDVYSAGGTPSLGAEVAYELDTTSVITLTPVAVAALLGSNTFTANSGDILFVKYFSKEA